MTEITFFKGKVEKSAMFRMRNLYFMPLILSTCELQKKPKK